jgi:hypothetical protein
MTSQSFGRLMAALALCTLFGCTLGDDNDADACAGDDPSASACASDSDCAGGERCLAVAGECKPSSCSCDAATGTWTCTEDCGPKMACQAGSACREPAPATEYRRYECELGAPCGTNGVCKEQPTSCTVTDCSCDESTGQWSCREVCAPWGTACEELACDGLDPSQATDFPEDSCDELGAACGVSGICTAGSEFCGPTSCECDASTGAWDCTVNCKTPRSCEPACAGADPSLDGCALDADCGAGELCAPSADTSCRPSSCMCDAVTGDWSCTEDCNPRHACL